MKTQSTLLLKSDWFRDGAGSQAVSAKGFDLELEGEAVCVGCEKTHNNAIFVRELAMHIVEEDADIEPPADVWSIAMGNHAECVLGDSMQAKFGAEKASWAHVCGVERSFAAKESRVALVIGD